MPDSLALAWLMLPLGVALGWYLCRRWPKPQEQTGKSPSQYPAGFAQTARQDSDQAIAALIGQTGTDDQTVELHLTLGTLFRKCGEVDRALRLHESLLMRTGLSPAHRNRARFELAQDFHSAGVMDRAEALFKQLVGQGMFLQPALESLVTLYEQAYDWRQALETARQLEAVKGVSLRPLIGHYYCELSEAARQREDATEALRLAGRALSEHAGCVRASLLQGALHEASGQPAAAVKSYRRVPEQDARFIGEVLIPLQRCYEKLHSPAAYREFLEEAEELWVSPAVVLARAQMMQKEHQDPGAYLMERLQRQPQWRGLDLLLQSATESSSTLAPLYKGLRDALRAVMEKRPGYDCQQCGFRPMALFWQCPSCRQWGTVVPLNEL
ncbi:MAG: tetratricopeptide repeat protein [Nevskiales bacterium]|nr:tetratricopeptide repeat protein [Nevskiales bacterium]